MSAVGDAVGPARDPNISRHQFGVTVFLVVVVEEVRLGGVAVAAAGGTVCGRRCLGCLGSSDRAGRGGSCTWRVGGAEDLEEVRKLLELDQRLSNVLKIWTITFTFTRKKLRWCTMKFVCRGL